jgi:GNAT superfamily N-acetyltransferase
MPNPIGAYSPEAVIQAIEDNLVGASTILGRTEDGVVYRGKDVTWVYTGHRSLSRVLRARFPAEQAEDRIAEIFDCFREWDAPVSWVVGPTSWPPELATMLRDSGFATTGHIWTGLARDVPETVLAPVPMPPTFAIGRATTAADLATWTTVSGDPGDTDPAGGGDHTAAPDIFGLDNVGGDLRCRFYLATVDGRHVARGMAYQSGDVVGLYWFAVAPDCHGLGYDVALAAQALADAHHAGARLAVIPARGPIQQLGQQLGFVAYCQFHVHGWPPAPLSHA